MVALDSYSFNYNKYMTQRQLNVMWGVVVVILLGIVFYLAFSNRNDYGAMEDNSTGVVENTTQENEVIEAEPKVETENEVEEETVKADETIDPKADWKTYTNKMAFPFSIQYPSNFWVSGNCMGEPSTCSGASLIDPNNNQAIIMMDYAGAFMAPETLKTVAEREQKINNKNNDGNASAVKAVTYGNNKGYSFTVQNVFYFDDQGSGISLSSSATVVYFTTKGRVTRILYSNTSPVYKEIINTFKFL